MSNKTNEFLEEKSLKSHKHKQTGLVLQIAFSMLQAKMLQA